MTTRLKLADDFSAILSQHIAVLGKTGSGKTSTAKLAIEQVVADGARVCVLDPIKSDWWGLTSSANGKHAGLPFHILGGPHGHVPLHSAAGKAIADVVASGALPLSIIDMADFEPGGQARFFVDFAPALLRKMRGVVYLVIEEAHLFAPKERSGIGAENLSIHWAKTLATAGRSKGVRLVLVTQRTQALHNALLGSCDTLIAHRLTAPADQDPVVKWLKANTSKEVLEQVSSSLASLKTGEGWICSGEAKLFERVHFPRISTYDNTATPTGDGEDRDIKTAPVDPEKLRAIIGTAVDAAKADDPRELRKQIAELKQQAASASSTAPVVVKQEARPVLTDADRTLIQRVVDGSGENRRVLEGRIEERVKWLTEALQAAADSFVSAAVRCFEAELIKSIQSLETKGFQKILDKLATVSASTPIHPTANAVQRSPLVRRVPPVPGTNRPTHQVSENGNRRPGAAQRAFLTALAHRQGKTTTRNQLAVFTGYSAKSSHVDNTISSLRTAGWATGQSNAIAITDTGLAALGPYDELPTGEALIAHWVSEAGSAAGAMLKALVRVYPKTMTRDEVAEATGYSTDSSHVDNSISRLRTLQLVTGGRQDLCASEELFV